MGALYGAPTLCYALAQARHTLSPKEHDMLDDYLIDMTDHMTTDAGTFRIGLYEDVDARMFYPEEDAPEGYVGYVIERLVDPWGDVDPDDDEQAKWEHVDSLWAIDDRAYAEELAIDEVNGYRAADFPSRALATQV